MATEPRGLASHIIFRKGSTYYAQDGDGNVKSGTDASAVIQGAIDSLPNGGRIHIKAGVYPLTSPLAIEGNSIHISGETKAGDIFFTNDSAYHGFSSKVATVLVAEGNGIEIGKTNLVFGTTIEGIGITGVASEEAMGDDVYTKGAGIRVFKAEVTRIQDVQIQRKEHGLHFAPPGPFAYDKVIDVVIIDNLLLCFNLYGIYAEGWVTGVRVNTLFGYINQRGLIHAFPQYDWIVRDVWSNADSWNSSDPRDAPVYIGTGRDVTLENVTIAGQSGTKLCPVPLAWIDCCKVGDHGARVSVRNITLLETQSDAMRIDGNGDYVFINGIYAGIHGFYGGEGTVKGSAVRSSPGVKVSIDGGAVSCCGEPFVGVDRVSNVYTEPAAEAPAEAPGCYLVCKDGTKVYAKDPSGAVLYSGTDAGAALNVVNSKMPPGSTVRISGSLEARTQVNFTKDLTIIAEGSTISWAGSAPANEDRHVFTFGAEGKEVSVTFVGGTILYDGPSTRVYPLHIHSKYSSFRGITVDHTIFLHSSTIGTRFEGITQRGRHGGAGHDFGINISGRNVTVKGFRAELESKYQAGFVINSYSNLPADNIVLDGIQAKGAFGSFVHWYVPKSSAQLKSGSVAVRNFSVEYTDAPDYGHFATFPLLDTEFTSGAYSGDFGRITIENGVIKGPGKPLVGKENGIGVISLLSMEVSGKSPKVDLRVDNVTIEGMKRFADKDLAVYNLQGKAVINRLKYIGNWKVQIAESLKGDIKLTNLEIDDQE